MPRAKTYDPDTVLQSAMQLFWTEGFETTSIPKLEKRLGINRFSIYDSFGSKRNLFLRSLESYTAMLVETLVEPLERGTGGLRDLDDFLSQFRRLFVDNTPPRGCLLCNTATEIGHRDNEIAARVTAYCERVEAALFQCLSRARELGEVHGDSGQLRERALVARSCVQGLLVDIRLGRTTPEIVRSVDALKTCIVGAVGEGAWTN